MQHYPSFRELFCLLATGTLSLSHAANAQQLANYEFSVRADVNVSTGKPSNDIPGFSLIGRFRVDPNWLIGVGVGHSPLFDVERPYEFIDLTSPEEVDAEGTSTMLSAWGERRYGEQDGGAYWYWTLGVGFNSVDVDDVQGETNDGDPWDITIDAGTETVLMGSIGRRHFLGERWLLGYGARLAHHFADWQVRDEVSGNESTIDDYTVHGIFGDVTYRF
jgi:hypothetical protein